MSGTPETAKENGKRGGRPRGAATQLTRAKANELCAAGDDGLSVMVDNMKFWRDKAREIGGVMEEQLARIRDMKDADAVAEALKEFNKTSVFFLAAREHAHRCAVDVAPYTNPRLQSITVKKDITKTTITMDLKTADDGADRSYRDGAVVPFKRPA